MANYGKKVQSDNKHLEDLANAQFVHLDGGNTGPITVSSGACNLARVVINSNGLAFNLVDGSRQIAQFATTSVEGTYKHGVYCENNLVISSVSGTGSATVVFN